MSFEQDTTDAATLVAAVFEELPSHDQDNPNGYTCTTMPVLEAECAWAGTGLIWTGYTEHEVVAICRAIAAQVALSLAVAGYLRTEPVAVPSRKEATG